MAGIGFELRNLFKEKGFFRKLNAVVTSSFVTVGPSLVCIGAIATIQVFMRQANVPFQERELLLTLVTYSFIFSLILTGGYAMTAARHVSNLLFMKHYSGILPALYGFLAVTFLTTGAASVIFLLNIRMTGLEQVLAWFLVMLLSGIWMESTFLSAVRSHRYLAASFTAGLLVGIVMAVPLLFFQMLPTTQALLISLDTGFAVILTAYHFELLKSFGRFRFSLSESFAWLADLDQYPQLPFIGFLYYFGIYGHIFIFWAGSSGVWLQSGIRYAPVYDMPSFYAILSIFPALVFLVVRFETSLAAHCRTYYDMASGKGSILDIQYARRQLAAVVESELQLFIRLQLIMTLVSLAVGLKLLPRIGFSYQMVDTFSALVMGNFGFVSFYAVCLVLLYFDDRIWTLILLGIFNALSILFSIASQWAGEGFHGVGYAAATLVVLSVSILVLSRRLRDLDYSTFTLQPAYRVLPNGLNHRLYSFLFRKE